MSSDPQMKATVRHVVSKLVQGDYEGLEQLTADGSLSATEMEQGIVEYGDKLLLPPDSAFESLDIIEVEGAQPRKWSVNFDCGLLTTGVQI